MRFSTWLQVSEIPSSWLWRIEQSPRRSISIAADDMMGSRDCGWVQIYCENSQEAYDWTLQAFRIGEHPEIQLPVSVNVDGFVTTHAMENLKVLADGDVRQFLPPRKAGYTIDPAVANNCRSSFPSRILLRIEETEEEAIRNVHAVIESVAQDYYCLTGRQYGLIETCGMEDAEAAVLCMGSTVGQSEQL